jgi:hypothetical protein
MADANLVFLPWVRQGMAARLTTPDPLAAPLPAQAGFNARLEINGEEGATMPLIIAGAGEVIGLDARQVVRMEPPPNTSDYESNDLAAVEFDNPDLPWLFTPAAADAQGRLRPWLVLVVVRKGDGVVLRPPGTEALPVLEIAPPARPADELPDLAESWAWTHAQLAAPAGASTDALLSLLATQPAHSVARLVSPRLLDPFTRYIACVVPAFEAGRLAGLKLPITGANASQLAPAWKSGANAPAQIALPVFHHWEFATGAREDFESLVRKLVPRDLAGLVGRRPMSLDQPGFPVGNVPLPALPLEGALQPVHAPRTEWPDAQSAGWQATLRAIVNAAALPAPNGTDPLVGPPIYGRWYAQRSQVGDAAPPTWLDDLNLDPRERVAAALGTRVVQDAQEALVAQAWQQAGEIDRANQRLRQMQLSLVVGARLHAKQVQGLGSDDDALWRLAAPAQARLVWQAATPQAPAVSMRAFIASTATPLALTSAPMRRITRPQGAISRRAQLALREVPLATGTGTASTGLGTGIATSTSIGPGTLTAARAALGTTTLQLLTQPLTMIFVLPPTRGLVSFDAASRRLPAAQAPMAYAGANDLAVGNAPPRPGFQIVTAASPFVVTIGATLAQPRLPPHPVEPPEPPEPAPPKPPPPHPPKPVDSADAQAFRAAAKRHLARVNPFSFILVLPAPRPALDVVAARGTLVQLLDPAPALQLRMAATITLAGGAAPPAIAPLGHAPHFEQPMSEPLATLSQDWLLPGLDRVLPDTVALLEPNSRFVEAFMAGLNVEMGRELLWRDYPLDDPCATFFRRFWRSAQPQGEGDIAALAGWSSNRLGANPGTGVASKQSVLLVRSGLFRRYPGALVYAVPATRDATGRKPDIGATHRQPLFRGSLQPDVTFFGFDVDPADAAADPGWYFVIEQQPTEPRFGFDVEIDFGSASHVPLAAPPAGFSLPAGTQWARNAAHMAQITRQQPVRVAIHASELLAGLTPAPTPTS